MEIILLTVINVNYIAINKTSKLYFFQTCATCRHIILKKLNTTAAQSQAGVKMLREVASRATTTM